MLRYCELLFYLSAILPVVFGDCPPPEGIHPCTCRDSVDGGMLECWNMYNPQDLVYPIAATVGHKMFAIAVMNSSFMYIPHDVFKGTTFRKVRLYNTAVMALTDTDEAFEGLESTMEEFRATGSHYSAQWHWHHLSKLKNMELIDVNYVQLDALQDDIPDFPKLDSIGIVRGGITYVSDTVFANLPKLKIWDMRHNEISELKRSMLPKPAIRLSIMNLEDNKLKSLPTDFFEDMPSLTFLNLKDNQFVSLYEGTFKTVFRDVDEIYFNGNPIRCDCRMSWLFGTRSSYHFTAECQQPESLKGRKIMTLSSKELNCPRSWFGKTNLLTFQKLIKELQWIH